MKTKIEKGLTNAHVPGLWSPVSWLFRGFKSIFGLLKVSDAKFFWNVYFYTPI